MNEDISLSPESRLGDSNSGPTAYKAVALPTELRRLSGDKIFLFEKLYLFYFFLG